MANQKVAAIRDEYTLGELLEKDLGEDPFSQFGKWFEDALKYQVLEPNAMVLSTASLDGKPSSRVVLLKDFNEKGFVFYTNYQSRKGQEIGQNPLASLLFFWPELQRQVRIEGQLSQVSAAESDAYFHSRPFGSQLGAVASPQSQVVPHREYLEERLANLIQQYPAGSEVPRPPHWGGFLLTPHSVEFWQGRANRLHDRLVYTKKEDAVWHLSRLAP